MKRKRNTNNNGSLVLADGEKRRGYFLMFQGGSAMLLRSGKPVAWFSAALPAETIEAVIKLITSCDEEIQTANNRRSVA